MHTCYYSFTSLYLEALDELGIHAKEQMSIQSASHTSSVLYIAHGQSIVCGYIHVPCCLSGISDIRDVPYT